MEEQLISFKTARLAKEKKFAYWNSCTCGGFPDCICENRELATHSILQKWLREKYKININCIPSFTKHMEWSVEVESMDVKYISNLLWESKLDEFDTYEEALEIGLQEALKLIKN